MVTADGALVQASAAENPDLFWAIRGGGGNFGVVTSFEFKLHPVGPDLTSGLIVHPFARARELLAGYRKVAAAAPDELTIWVVLRKAPPLPFLPAEVHGKEILVFAVCYAGDPAEGGERVGAASRTRRADRRRDRRAALRGLADGIRSAAHAGGVQLLEVAQFQGSQRRTAGHSWSMRSGRCRRGNARSSSPSSVAPATALPPTRPLIRIATPIS